MKPETLVELCCARIASLLPSGFRAKVFSPNALETNCSLTNNVPTYFMKVLGISSVNLAAHAEAIVLSKLENYPGLLP